MDKPHKEVMTTHPVAIKKGQGQIHVRAGNLIPWHSRAAEIKCPKCDVIYIVGSGYPDGDFILTVLNHHKDQQEHPDYIASAPQWTHVIECDCGDERN